MQVRFTASVSGSPDPDITWYKDGQKVEASKNRTISSTGSLCNLIVKSIQASDVGVYKIVASNRGGEVSAEATLSIEG